MNTNKRIGSVIPCENVDPHTGSFLDYGVIVGWENDKGQPTTRRNATYAVVEMTGKKVNDWNEWAKEHAWELKSY